MSYSHHVDCFKLPRGLSSVSIEEFVEDYLTDGGDERTGQSLFPDQKDEAIRLLHQAAEKKKKGVTKKKSIDEDKETILFRLKVAVKAEEDDAKEPPKKKMKKEMTAKNDDSDEFQAMVPVYKKYHKKKLEELKDILRWNNQILKGTKDFVLFKIVDGELHGRLGFCPLCQGNLKLNDDDLDNVHCGGRFDEETSAIQVCSYSAPRAGVKSAPRLLPFYVEPPVRLPPQLGTAIYRGSDTHFKKRLGISFLRTDRRRKGSYGGRKSQNSWGTNRINSIRRQSSGNGVAQAS
jgi:hypothetical protein